ncbi:MAG TPA: hypothetical protein DCR04_05945 [Flavobacteriales bacterium]|nr:hypothetical protein [Flavobacteriales bacterium]
MVGINDIKLWLTGAEFDLGKELHMLDVEDVFTKKYASIYYSQGLAEFDRKFLPKGYIKSDYVCTLNSYLNGIAILFMQYSYDSDRAYDMGFAYINRENLAGFSIEPADNLEVVVIPNKMKSQLGYHLTRGGGLVGALVGIAANTVKKVKTHLVSGYQIKLNYLTDQREEKQLVFYCEEERKMVVELFLNTYYKKDLPEEATTPVEDSGCFIATACYKDIFSPEVIFFRKYRDKVLKQSRLGRVFIRTYYLISPWVYVWLYNHQFVSIRVKSILNSIYTKLNK